MVYIAEKAKEKVNDITEFGITQKQFYKILKKGEKLVSTCNRQNNKLLVENINRDLDSTNKEYEKMNRGTRKHTKVHHTRQNNIAT